MRITASQMGGSATVRLAGELDALTVRDLLPVLDEVVRGSRRVVMDLSELRAIDSAGVKTLARADRTLRAHGGALEIDGACAQPLALFRLVRLDRMLTQRPGPRTSADQT
jgi:anti-sigma B factor antagonist